MINYTFLHMCMAVYLSSANVLTLLSSAIYLDEMSNLTSKQL